VIPSPAAREGIGRAAGTEVVLANQRLKLTGAAILVSRGMKALQAAPAP
jgi:hypothetical protein